MIPKKLHDYFGEGSPLRDIQDALGDDVALRLRTTLGGAQYRFPTQGSVMIESHWLVKAMGRTDAENICAVLSGETVYISRPPKEIEILRLSQQGLGTTEIARQTGMTQRHIRRTLRKVGISAGTNTKLPVRRSFPSKKAAVLADVGAKHPRIAILTPP